jgi:D-3-phosphoglycerate dehydrogenase / 2-oxoglutarate reductase
MSPADAADNGRPKVLVKEKIGDSGVDLLRQHFDVDIGVDWQDGELAERIGDYHGILIRSATKMTAELIDKGARLRVIGRAGVGVDNIDADAATRRGIVVMNTPGANAIAVAELTIGLMLALARQLPRANGALHQGRWEKKSLSGAELRGKTLAVLGLGRVGLEVAQRAASFGMQIIGHDPFVAPALARERGVELVDMDALFARADYLTLHVGLTPQTANIINAKNLAAMKKGVRIVNCARGELVEDAALLAALDSGKVAGAALDVFRDEPLKNSPYFIPENVILTPHIAGSTAEAQEAVGIQIAAQVREYLKLGVVQNAVNVPSLSHEEYVELSPYINMAARLGAFLSATADGNVESITLTYRGRLAQGKTDLVRNAAIQGVLAHSENVNAINAAAVAEERGIRLHESKVENGGAASGLSVTLHTRGGEATATATVLHGRLPRLLASDGIDIEVPLHGTLIAIRNHDVPGVIGRVGTVLGEHQVNIANFALGRAAGSVSGAAAKDGVGGAIAVVQVDGEITPTVIGDLEAIEAVTRVRLIKLPPLP